MISSKDTLLKIFSHFKAPIEFSFGYGSGVFSQGAKSSSKARQIDIIFGVENAQKWHAQNIEQNPHHYSGLRHLGSAFVAFTQNKLGAGVYFNPYVQLENQVVKYGVVELETLKRDLTQWETLYLAGRLHKPVRVIKHHPMIAEAQRQNLKSAMSTALLMLPKEFSELDLYTKIAAVSYMGDVRMAFAENPKKVQNIVTNQFGQFRSLYLPLFKDLEISGPPLQPSQETVSGNTEVGPMSKGFALSQASNNEDKLLNHLPSRFRAIVTKNSRAEVRPIRVSKAVAQTIKYPSFTQSLKGILTAGVSRSIKYSMAKLAKRKN